MKLRNNIQAIMLVGDKDIAQAIGICDQREIAKLRAEGMPYGKLGKSYVYFPNDVEKWLKKRTQESLQGKTLKPELLELIGGTL